MGLNNPVPRSLGKEARKAAKVLSSFVKPNQILGQDMVIPAHVLANAKGLAIITVLKAGFLFSGRAGSGVIVARLPDGGWSAPSAIVTAGAGVGGQIGAEITDFVFILNTRAAVESFSQAGSITLGGNVSLAAGPLGRNAEAAGSASLKSVAAIFAYSKTKGLFAGVSLEGSLLVERREANRKFYGSNCTAKQILSGRVEPPPECDALFRVLESRALRGVNPDDFDDFYDDIPDYGSDSGSSSRRSTGGYRSGGRGGQYSDDDDYGDDVYSPRRDREREREKERSDRDSDRNGRDRRGYGRDDDYDRPSSYGRAGSGGATGGGSGGGSRWQDDVYDQDVYSSRSSRRTNGRRNDDGFDDVESTRQGLNRLQFNSTYSDYPDKERGSRGGDRDRDQRRGSRQGQQYSADNERRRAPPPPQKPTGLSSGGGERAIAKFTFDGEEDGDLSFRKGDIISIVKRSESADDWWTGSAGGKQGIFPANYVELV